MLFFRQVLSDRATHGFDQAFLVAGEVCRVNRAAHGDQDARAVRDAKTASRQSVTRARDADGQDLRASIDGQVKPTLRESAEEAAHLLEMVAPQSRELAMACAVACQRHAVAGNDPESFRWGRRALEIGGALGDETVVVHALVTLAMIDIYADADR